MVEQYLIPVLAETVKQYVGEAVKVYSSRGKEEWDCILIQCILQPYLERRNWVKQAVVMDVIAEAYIAATPFYHKTLQACRELYILPCCADDFPDKVEFLLYMEQDVMEPLAIHNMVECSNGLVVPKPYFPQINVNNLGRVLAQKLCCALKSVAVSCVSKEYFDERWCKNIGGHGYDHSLNTVYELHNAEIDRSSSELHCRFLTEGIQHNWAKRKREGCLLAPHCNCVMCLEDASHTSCSEQECPFFAKKQKL